MRIIRKAHVCEGQSLKVVKLFKRHNQYQYQLLFPDRTRRFVPVQWTDMGGSFSDETNDAGNLPAVGLSQLRELRMRCELLSRRSDEQSA